MCMRTIKSLGAFLLGALSAASAMAQQTYEEMEQLTVNEQVTTVITASEPVRFVDISTDKVVGDQPISNTIRLKPKEGADVHADGEVLVYESDGSYKRTIKVPERPSAMTIVGDKLYITARSGLYVHGI